MTVDSPFTSFTRTTLGGTLVAIVALVIFGATLVWATRPGHLSRRAVLYGGGAGAVFTALSNAILGSTGVWRSTIYTLPAPVLGSYLILLFSLLAWMVVFYRWLIARRAGPLIAVGLIALVFGLIVVGDELALERGYIGFGGGYTAWVDALVGVVMLLVPVGAYERLRPKA